MSIDEWLDTTSPSTFPKDYIPCPLPTPMLHESYSLTHHSPQVLDGPSIYLDQEQAYIKSCKESNLTTHTPTTTYKRHKPNQKSYSPQTIESRVSTMRNFIGFCVLHLHLEPIWEHIMDPSLVAKYFGFHMARCTSFATLSNQATNLKSIATFVPTNDCPKSTPQVHFSPTYISRVMEWLTNLKSKAFVECKEHKEEKPIGSSLWSVWEHTQHKWEAFQAKLKVRC